MFYPKKYIIGGLGGFLEPGDSAYREEYSCLGIKYRNCPNIPDYGCENYCFGIIYDKKCSIVSMPDTNQFKTIDTQCRD